MALRPGVVLTSLGAVARRADFHRLAWAATLAFAAQFLYIGGSSIFMVELLGKGELDFWKLFVPMIGAMMLGFLGLVTSVWAEKFDHAAAVTNFVVTPLALLSGTFYSVDRLAPWFQGVAHANPVYYAIMGFRFGFIGTVDSTISHPVLTAALVLVATNIVLGVITYRLLVSGWKLKA